MKKLFLLTFALALLCIWSVAMADTTPSASTTSERPVINKTANIPQPTERDLEKLANEAKPSSEVLSGDRAPEGTVSGTKGETKALSKAPRPTLDIVLPEGYYDAIQKAKEERNSATTPNIPDQNIILQGGDNCGSAVVIPSVPYSDAGTTAGYTDDYNEICPYTTTGAPDVVYSYTPTADQTINISLCNSSYDTKVYVYAASCPDPGNPVACNDDACGSDGYKSQILNLALTGGTTYYIVVDGFSSGDYGDYQLDITGPCDVTCPSGAYVEAEACGDDTNGGCNSTPNVWENTTCGETVCGTFWFDGSTRDTDWYRFTLTEAQHVTMSGQAEQDVMFAIVWTDCVNFAYTLASPCTDASFSVDLAAGDYYAFAAPQFTNIFDCTAPDEYYFTVTCEALPDCFPDDYLTAPVTDLGGNTCGAGNDCGLETSEDIIYSVTIPYDGDWAFSLCGSSYDTKIYVGSLCCQGDLGYNDDACGGTLQSEVIVNGLTAGEYFVAIEGYNGACGAYVFNVYEVLPCDITCPTPNTPEAEACGDDTNGGCNATIPGPDTFEPVTCGETICGTAWFDGSTRDTDWYIFTLDEQANVTVTAEAEFDLQVLLMYPSAPPAMCPASYYTYIWVGPCVQGVINWLLEPGTYYVWMGPQFTSTFGCSEPGDEYYFTLTCEPTGGAYCDICYTNQTDDWITNVTFNTINNTTGMEVNSCSYGDYTGLSTDIQQLSTYNLSVSFYSGGYTEYVKAWIDWNQNYTFETSEGYELGFGADATVNMDITVPLSAVLGPTRMRVVERWNNWPVPCESYTYGEAEDYTVNITGAPPCDITCPTPNTPEAEACGNDTNGGCNADIPGPDTFESVACGETICGTSWCDGSSRDTDWYLFTLDEPQTITLTGMGEFPFQMLLVGQSSPPALCPAYVIESGLAGPCEEATLTYTLQAGTYYAWMGPQNWDFVFGCTDNNEYYFTLTCEAPPLGACCDIDYNCFDNLNIFDCLGGDGEGWYEGESCPSFACPVPRQVGLATTGNIPDVGVSNYGPLGETETQGNTCNWNGMGAVNFAGTFVMGNSPTAMFSYYNQGVTDCFEYTATGLLDMSDTFHPLGQYGDGGVLGNLSIDYCGHGYNVDNPPAEAADIFVHVFTVKNNGPDPVDNYYAGAYFDWDIGGSDLITFDRADNLIVQGPDETYNYGICLLNAADVGLTSLAGVSQNDYIYPTGPSGGGWKMDDLYMVMSAGTDQIWDAYYSDMSSLVSSGPHTINPGESITFEFAVIGGAAVADVEADAQYALANLDIPPCGGVSPYPCGHYVIGDWNGSESFNVADIIASFGKLKGQPNTPALLCECPPGSGNTWAVAMDVNGNCAFNLADVIWGFGKLKGQPNVLAACPACPPAPSPAPGGGNEPLLVPNLKSKAKISTSHGME